MKKLLIYLFLPALLLFSSCNKKQIEALQGERDQYQSELAQTQSELEEARRQLSVAEADRDNLREQLDQSMENTSLMQDQVGELQDEISRLSQSEEDLLQVLEKLSVVSPQGASDIKESLLLLQEEEEYLDNLAANLTRSIGSGAEGDVQVEVLEGRVMVSLSDQLLFPSGVADVQMGALQVLGPVARILNDQPRLQVQVRGHTDNLPIRTDCWQDNWDLSAQRAAAVVRVLQWRFQVDPGRITLAGSSQYSPKADNSTAAGRRLNRRTEIILTPTLDQLLELVRRPD